MSELDKKKLETDLFNFTHRNFETPSDCRDINQIRFYIKELSIKIRDYEGRFNFVPDWAYALLAQYNIAQHRLLHVELRKGYC